MSFHDTCMHGTCTVSGYTSPRPSRTKSLIRATVVHVWSWCEEYRKRYHPGTYSACSHCTFWAGVAGGQPRGRAGVGQAIDELIAFPALPLPLPAPSLVYRTNDPTSRLPLLCVSSPSPLPLPKGYARSVSTMVILFRWRSLTDSTSAVTHVAAPSYKGFSPCSVSIRSWSVLSSGDERTDRLSWLCHANRDICRPWSALRRVGAFSRWTRRAAAKRVLPISFDGNINNELASLLRSE